MQVVSPPIPLIRHPRHHDGTAAPSPPSSVDSLSGTESLNHADPTIRAGGFSNVVVCYNCDRWCPNNVGYLPDSNFLDHATSLPPVCSAECYWTCCFGGVPDNGDTARRIRVRQRARDRREKENRRLEGSKNEDSMDIYARRKPLALWQRVADQSPAQSESYHAMFKYHDQTGFLAPKHKDPTRPCK